MITYETQPVERPISGIRVTEMIAGSFWSTSWLVPTKQMARALIIERQRMVHACIHRYTEPPKALDDCQGENPT
jgi:hypothetical protein